jgi:ABC-type nitrate/sulfonate/bicarbonate transport system substrate-binding protein
MANRRGLIVPTLALLLAACSSGASGSPSSPADSGAPSVTGAPNASPPAELTPIKFHYDWVPTSGDVPMLAAEKLGYFRDAGISVTTTPG